MDSRCRVIRLVAAAFVTQMNETPMESGIPLSFARLCEINAESGIIRFLRLSGTQMNVIDIAD